jgi:hypothetical protein
MVSQPFTTGENQSYLKFWVITGNPQYPGYFTLTKLKYIEVYFDILLKLLTLNYLVCPYDHSLLPSKVRGDR